MILFSNKEMNNILILECLDSNTKNFYKDIANYEGDAGFDLYCPNDITIPGGTFSFKINLGVKSSLISKLGKSLSFMLVPRSSMGLKSPLRLSNSIGIIDSGYRGELIAVVDNTSSDDFFIAKGSRFFQIVPFDGLGVNKLILGDVDFTERGENGFGSTNS